jgi:RNA polymerase sigma-70 factor (ECF subfamily)
MLQRARGRDARAWEQIVKLYRPLVLFWCTRGGVTGPNAEDLVQDVFAAAALGLAGFRRDRPGDTFRGWLRGITRKKILLHYRRDGRHVGAAGGSAAWKQLQQVAEPLAGCEQDEQRQFTGVCREVVEQVRGEFEERTWQAFWMTVMEGRSPATLTGELGMAAAAIRQAKSRVLRRLKEECGELME